MSTSPAPPPALVQHQPSSRRLSPSIAPSAIQEDTPTRRLPAPNRPHSASSAPATPRPAAMEPATTDPGEKSLAKLLSTLTATLHPATYVFTTLSPDSPLPPLAEIQLLFRETEGTTLIVSLDYAQAQHMRYFFPCRMMTLDVTSSLEAVGFMAVIAARLAACGMGVNPVSGFHHDHLFVPAGRADEAVEVLAALAEEKRGEQHNS
ncbi:hypothetical protein G6O67_003610 [Ophiocordyceps sinensis]|uniref:DUF2241 domain-containing protein n=1 Tax=Ophiocordyceps sinensis TaxID=72228 RepID=A0A8H4V6H4_9HYPO|nr:hypothetical protein G6O67_003610 [Ophiocordyceps sinensis]